MTAFQMRSAPRAPRTEESSEAPKQGFGDVPINSATVLRTSQKLGAFANEVLQHSESQSQGTLGVVWMSTRSASKDLEAEGMYQHG